MSTQGQPAHQLRQLVPRDAISPIYSPRFEPGVSKLGSIVRSPVRSGDLVIGVELNGESKAYPLGPLTYREMVNDFVGGVPILVTWEPSSYTVLVVDRRVAGKPHTFGNKGALLAGGMTWWDHETGSIWSQPSGRAVGGSLKGTGLDLIAADLVPWSTWLAHHPDTLVLRPETLVLELSELVLSAPGQRFRPDFVIGIVLGEKAKAYPFTSLSEAGVLNDLLGHTPVAVLADAGTKAVHVFVREVGGTELEFTLEDGRLTDRQTDSTWSPADGMAVDGPLQGSRLERLAYITAFQRAWQGFYPGSEVYGVAHAIRHPGEAVQASTLRGSRPQQGSNRSPIARPPG